MSEKITLEVLIAGRAYPLKINKKDEDMVKRLVKNINQKIDNLREKYDAKDTQDYLAMCLLQLTAQQVQDSAKQQYPNIESQLIELEKLLEQSIAQDN